MQVTNIIVMTPSQIKVLIQSRNPLNGCRQAYQLMYGSDIFGGTVTPDVKIKGDVYLPMGSWATGKCTLLDVKIPFNVNIISLSVHDKHVSVEQIGDFKLVRDFRVHRGVYVSGLVRIEDHDTLNAKVIIGYELKVYGRSHLTDTSYKKTQKKDR